MKKIELVLGFSALISAILNLFDYPMSAQLLIVSIGNLSIFYMYLGIPLLNNIPFRKIFQRASYEGISKLRFIGALALGLTLSASLLGLLFKLMLWPNANLELVIGFSGLCIALGVAIWRYLKNNDSFYMGVFKRIAIFMVLVVGGLAIPKYAVLEFKYSEYPGYVEAFIQRNEHPNNKEFADNLEIERQKMLDEMRVKQTSEE